MIDIDAHKGDGTATLTQNDSSIKLSASIWRKFGLMLYTSKSIPASDFDLPIRAQSDRDYNFMLQNALEELKVMPIPDLAVVIA